MDCSAVSRAIQATDTIQKSFNSKIYRRYACIIRYMYVIYNFIIILTNW